MSKRNIEAAYPLSPAQEGMLFHSLFSPESGVYVTQLALQLDHTDVDLFERCWQELVAQHPVLRTAFVWRKTKEPVQVVGRRVVLPVERLNWRALLPEEWAGRLQEFMAADRERGFEPAKAPLMRLTLIQLDEHRHYFVWSHHHLLLDGWSMSLLLGEVAERYRVEAQNQAFKAPRRRPFRDYIAWLSQQSLEEAEDYWRRTLKGYSEPVPLAIEKQVAGDTQPSWREEQYHLSAADTTAINAFAQRSRLTLNTVCQGAWSLLFSRYSGASDLVFGIIVSGRPGELPEVERMVGLFINTLPMRVKGSPGTQMGPWLTEIQSRQAKQQRYDHTPLAQVQRLSDMPKGVGLFEHILVFENYPAVGKVAEGANSDERGRAQGQANSNGHLRIHHIETVEQPNFPLAVLLVPSDRLLVRVIYDPNRYERLAILRLQRHLATLLCEMAGNEPSQSLGSLSLLTPVERQQALREWNDTVWPESTERAMHHPFCHRAAAAPAAIAAVFEDQHLSYGELDRESNRLAHQLRDSAIGRGSLVAVMLTRSLEMIPSLLGILKAGAAYVPLEPVFPEARIRYILETLKIRCMITQGPWLEKMRMVVSADGEATSPLEQVICPDLGQPWSGEESFGVTTRLDLSTFPTDDPAVDVRSEDPAYIIFTSGSTGTPKGVVERHRPVLNLIDWVERTCRFGPLDRVLFTTSLCFDLSVFDVFGLLAVGGSLRIASADDLREPQALVRLMRSAGITFWDSAPAALQRLVPFFDAPGRSNRLRQVFLSGDWIPLGLPDAVRDAFPGAHVMSLGGATEATVWSNHFPVGEVRPEWASIPYGRPIQNARYHVLDAGLEPCPIGVAGDLYIAGICLASGYAEEPVLSASKFLPDPYGSDFGGHLYRTGDRARYMDDGNLEFLGRLDHQVKIRGYRIELGEIEAVLGEHPEVRTAVAMAREDVPGDRRLVAYVVPRGEVQPGIHELRQQVGDHLPDYMVPAAFVLLETLPVTSNGKVDRKALPAPGQERPDLGSDFIAPRTPVEETLAGIWGEVLGLERVGAHDNFFELGGDSILSIQIVSRAGRVGLKLNPQQLFEHQTVAELAREVSGGEAVTVEQGPVEGAVPLTPIQHWFFAKELPEPHHWNQALMFEVRRPSAEIVPLLPRALEHLLVHHDALRLRFGRGRSGWEQLNATPGDPVPFVRLDLRSLPAARRQLALEAAATRVQASLDLARGPLLRLAFFDLGEDYEDGSGLNPERSQARLLLVLHHLIVDGISWRILLEDLANLCQGLAAGQAPSLPAKTTSFKQWAERIAAQARSEDLAREASFWLEPRRSDVRRLPLDHPGGANSQGSTEQVRAHLDVEFTRHLLQRVPAVYRTQINDVLLAALTLTLGRHVGGQRFLIHLEGHGREEIFDGVDISRTVGWFTILFPVLLELAPETSAGAALKSIKEQLRALPGHGLGYGLLRYLGADAQVAQQLEAQPKAEVSFNYLGQLDQAIPADAPFVAAAESSGESGGRLGRREHVFDVDCSVLGGRLEVAWGYSSELHDADTARGLLDTFITTLGELIRHCLEPGVGGYTPSDFPLLDIAPQALDALVERAPGLDDLYALAPLQEGMLFHALNAPESGVYLQQCAATLEGPLDVDLLKRAWQAAAERHTVLRTAFFWHDLEDPCQGVFQRVELPFEEQDWRGQGHAEQDCHWRLFLDQDRQRDFDLSTPPAMRFTLLRLDEERYRLVWTYHHLVLDGWSVSLLLEEVFSHYAHLEDGSSPTVQDTRPYRDYIAWLAEQDPERAAAWWRRALQGLTAPTPLSPDYQLGAAPPEGAVGHGVLRHRTQGAVLATLEALAREHRLTLNTLVQGAWGVLLSRLTGEAEVVYGATGSGRPPDLPGVDSMVGMFINTLPVRLPVPPDVPLLAWLADLQQQQIEQREFEYSSLAEIQGYSAVPRGEALFDTILVFENYPLEDVQEATAGTQGVTITSIEALEQTNFGLMIEVTARQELGLAVTYDPERFVGTTMARLLGALETLLLSMAAAPDGVLGELSTLTPAARQQLLVEWNDVGALAETVGTLPADNERRLSEWFALRAAREPQRIALGSTAVGAAGWLSYGELARCTEHLAAALRAEGVGPETLVGLHLERSPALVMSLLAVHTVGAAYVPLDPTYPVDRLALMVQDAELPILLSSAETVSFDHGASRVLRLDERGRIQGRSMLAMESSGRSQSDPGLDALAYVIYTSGSTGRPKGVGVSQRAFLSFLLAMGQRLGLTAEDAFPALTPLSFDIAGLELFLPLLNGARVDLVSAEVAADGARLSRWLARERTTAMQATPATWRLLLDADWPGAPGFRALCGGEALPAELAALLRARAAAVWNLYGPTETTVWSAVRRLGPGPVTVGEPLANGQLYLLDRRLRPLTVGMPGELVIAGVGVARGYLGRPALTAEQFVPDALSGCSGGRMYRTGDLVRYRPTGEIDFLGRFDHQVKVRGYRIELGEVEVALGRHPAVAQAVARVWQAPNQPDSAHLVAYLIPEEGASASPEERVEALRAHLQESLPAYMVPGFFVELKTFPLTPNGKVDRKALPAPTAQHRHGAFLAPRTPVEAGLCEIWGHLLGVEQVGVEDDFMKLGGHSLLATRLMSRVRQSFGVDVPLATLFAAPTVAGLALAVEQALRVDEPPILAVSRQEPIPLSFAQQRLFFLDRLEPGSVAYNLPSRKTFHGEINPAALGAALSALIERHESLRTTFREAPEGDAVAGGALQIVAPPPSPRPVDLVDLSGLNPVRQQTESDRLATAEARRSFDLERGPLLRTTLLRRGVEECELLFTMHHIISDEWSMEILDHEVEALYGAVIRHRPSPLSPLPVHYADYACWQRARFAEQGLAGQLDYWRQRLAGVPTVLELPTDRPRPPVRLGRGAQLPLRLDRNMQDSLYRLAQESGATLFMTLLAALQALLARYSGAQDLCVGSPIAGRNRVEVEALIGFFVNTLVLRGDLAGNPTFEENLTRTRHTALEAYAHQDLPFEQLVDELEPERNLSHTPLFQVMLLLQNPLADGDQIVDDEATGGPNLGGTGMAKFDLTFLLRETPDGLSGGVEYDRDLFDATTIRRWCKHLEVLLRRVVEEPGLRLWDIPLLPEVERHQMLHEWNHSHDSATDMPAVHERIAARALRVPEAIALADGTGHALSYGVLRRRALKLAGELCTRGAAPGERVGIFLTRSPDMVVALLAVLETGAAYLPLDPTYPTERLRFMVDDAGPVLLLTQRSLLDQHRDWEDLALCLKESALVPRDAESPGLETGQGPSTPPERLAYTIYTSGSTGRPKGVDVPHGALMNFLGSMADRPGLRGTDHLAAVTSLSFDIATLELYLPLLFGARVELVDSEEAADGGRLANRLLCSRTTVLQATPATWHLLLDAGYESATGLRALCGGEALPGDLASALLPRVGELWNLYGPTETAVWSAARRVEVAADGPVPIGRPIARTRLMVVKHLEPMVLGVNGELCIAGAGVVQGYWGRQRLTAERFVPDPWSAEPGARLYRTGDLVRYRTDGNIDFLGRFDHQVKVRGYRIELGEIESVLTHHPAVSRAVVLAEEGAQGTRLVAFSVLHEPSPGLLETLRNHLFAQLPEYMVPALFVFLDALPLLPNGKVDRASLKVPEEAEVGAGNAPRTPVEAELAVIWGDLLERPRVGIHEDFFRLGGHSLLAMRVIARLRERLGVELPVRNLFEAPTVARLAQVVTRTQRADEAPMEILPGDEDGRRVGPVSFAQQRLWFLDQLQPGQSLYNLPIHRDLSGPFDWAALSSALSEVGCRHESLRTTFESRGGEPVQVVMPPPEAAPVPLVDLSALDSETRSLAALHLAVEEARRPFDLARGPLWRSTLLRLGSEDHQLLLTLHHIISDQWSLGILSEELVALYQSFQRGKASALAPLPVQYLDYSHWQRGHLSGEVMEATLAHWRQRLANAPAFLDLPTDRPRPAVRRGRGGHLAWRLSPALHEQLKACGQKEGVTLFMSLLASLQAVLSRFSGQQEVCIGSPIGGRQRLEVEGLIGFFVNTLVLRGDLRDDPTFAEFLARSRTTALEAFAHQALPFERLVEELQPERSLSHTPLFQVMLVLQNAPLGAIADSGPEVPMPSISGDSKFDLSLTLMESSAGLDAQVEFDRDLFDHTTIIRLLKSFSLLIEGAVAQPTLPLSRLPLAAVAERHQLLHEWNDSRDSALGMPAVHERIAERATRAPDAIALVDDAGQALSYVTLRRQTRALAGQLRARGAAPGERVGILLTRSPTMVVALLAVLETGAAYLPLDPTYPVERLRFMVDDASPVLLLTQPSLLDRHPAWRDLALCLDGAVLAPYHEATEGPGQSAATPPERLAYTIYTSGSTGRPKGVDVPHGALMNFLGSMAERPGLDSADHLAAVTSLSFDIATLELYLPLLLGARVELVASEVAADGVRLMERLLRARITVLQATPATWHLLLDAGEEGGSGLRGTGLRALCGGEALPGDLAAALLTQVGELWNLYGPTETAVWSAARRVQDGSSGIIAVGRPIAHTRLMVLDRHLQPVALGVSAEMTIAGGGVVQGYWERPALTAERFVPDPWSSEPGARLYRTGDLVRYRTDGTVDFLGRFDHQVKVRGYRIELGEIEAVLVHHPEVVQAVVVAEESAQLGTRLVAFSVLRSGASQDADALRAHLLASLPEYMVPALFVFLEALPLLPNGKVHRAALKVPEESVEKALGGAPRTPVEVELAAIWTDLLDRPWVGVDDDFFRLGGHSLLATRVVSRVRERLAVELPVRALFEAPTVARLARWVAEAQQADAEPITIQPYEADGRRRGPLSFSQQRLWFLDQLEPGQALYNLPIHHDLQGPLDLVALSRALWHLECRHETLRTTFEAQGSEPRQVVEPPPDRVGAVPLVDLSALEPKLRLSTATGLAVEEARRPFDLARGPLLRTTLLRLGPEDHQILFTMHHIISDEWSLGILRDEVAELYQSLREAGEAAPLAPLPVQYLDFSRWQHQSLVGEALGGDLDYWREQLAGAPPLLELPTDRPRPAVRRGRGGLLPWRFSAPLSAALTACGQQHGTTLFMALLAALQAVLARFSGQREVCVGSPIAGRQRLEVEGLLGFFVNTLVLRGNLGADLGFDELLKNTRATTLEAFGHQALPFERLVEELEPQRSLSYTPLFQVMLVVQNTPAGTLGRIDLPVEAPLLGSGTSKFDLTLTATEGGEGLAFQVQYDRDLFDGTTVRRLLTGLGRWIEGAVADTTRPISRLPLLPAAARHQVLAEWNDTAVAYDLEHDLARLVDPWVASAPEAIAVVAEAGENGGSETWLSYREVDARSRRLAAELIGRGVGPGSLVAVCVERSAELPLALLAVLRAGAGYAPLDASMPVERLAIMLEDSQSALLLTRRSLLIEGVVGEVVEGVAQVPPILCLEDLGEGGTLAVPSGDEVSFPRPSGDEVSFPRPSGDEVSFPRPSGDDISYLMFTSGSTGRPKGAMNSHRAIVNRLLWKQERFALAVDDVILHKTPVSFDVSVWELFWPLITGSRTVLARPEGERDISYLTTLIARQRITTAHFIPAMFHAFLDEPEARGCHSLRRVLCGGEALSWEQRERFAALGLGAEHHNLYGPAEAAIDVTHQPLANTVGRRVVPIGRPLANLRIHLLDRNLEPVSIGVTAELFIGGVGLGLGYRGRPAWTAERFGPDPFAKGERLYRSGDLARTLPGGEIEFLGRRDHQVKLRGVRIELGEIEALLAQAPAVAQAVVGLFGEGTRQRLVAHVVPRAESDPAALRVQLRDALRAQLPEPMVPRDFVFLDALPLGATGKVDRGALSAPSAEAEEARGVGSSGFESPAEEMLAAIWREVLGVQTVGREDDFFDLGGHSILATQVVSRARQAFAVDLSVRSLFEATTLGAFASHVEGAVRYGQPVAGDLLPQPRTASLPLSFAQQRLWVLDQLALGTTAYNVPLAVRLRGTLDVPALRRAMELLVQRHEVLRTWFRGGEGDPVLVIADEVDLSQPLVDLSGLAVARREVEAEHLVRADGERPFDLAQGPLLRIQLLRLSTSDHALSITFHHTIGDGWSSSILVRELVAIYETLGVDCAAWDTVAWDDGGVLPALTIQYADFAIWQRRFLTGEVLDAQLEWWRQYLADPPAFLELPTDRPRPAVHSFRGDRVYVSMDDALVPGLEALKSRLGVTHFMVLLAALQTLLYRLSGQDDLCIGTATAGRDRIELEQMVGFFANTLVLRGDLSGNPSSSELAARTRQRVLGAYAHQDLPFEKVVEELQPERNLQHTPFFQVMFAFHNLPRGAASKLPGLEIEPMRTSTGAAKFDLTLELVVEPALGGTLEYNTDLFDRSTILRLVKNLETLLANMVEHPEQTVDDLGLLTAAERQQLLLEWNDTFAEEPTEVTAIHRLFELQAARDPSAIAALFGDRQLTYGELEQQANQLARHLRSLGVGRGSMVALWLERSLEMIPALLGVLKAGAAYVPLEPSYPAARVEKILATLEVRCLLTLSPQLDLVRDLLPTSPGVEHVVCLDEAVASLPGVSLVSGADLADLDPSPMDVEVVGEDYAYVIFTSGSTGTPKGVVERHRAVLNLIRWVNTTYEVGPEDRLLFITSLCFDLSVYDVFGTLAAGGTIRIAAESEVRDPETLLEILCREPITFWDSAPAALQQLVTFLPGRMGESREAPLRLVFLSGDWIPVTLPDRIRNSFPQAQVVSLGGATEATVWSNFFPIDVVDPAWVSIPYGRPMTNARYHVFDARLRPVSVGVPGDLYIAGVCVASGYARDPVLSASKFLPDPGSPTPGGLLYRTGDRARYRGDGNLEFLGRLDHQVKIRGFRIELGEIEAVLGEHPGVQDVVVLARAEGAAAPGPAQDRRLVAYVVASGEPPPGMGDLRRAVSAKLPEYMMPSAFVLLPELPLTANGKLDRKALPAPDRVRPELSESFVEPRNEVEAELTRIWCEVLGLDRVGVEDNFFELGGDSILSIQIIARASKAGLHLTPRQLFEQPSIAELAVVVGTAALAEAEQGVVSGELPLTPVQHWFFEQRLAEPWHFNQSLFLEMREVLEPQVLRAAFEHVLHHHDALRLRFYRGAGGWRQEMVVPEDEVPFTRVDLSRVGDGALRSTLEKLAWRTQGSLGLEHGPLTRMLYVDLGAARPARLLWVIHHLAVDGYSWRVLMEDLATVYRHLATPEAPELPEKTTSFKRWAERQVEFARRPELAAELGFWRSVPRRRELPLPVDFPRGAHTERTARMLTTSLDAEDTLALLKEVPAAYHTQINEALLAALALTLSRFTGRSACRVDLEGHGREELGEALDVTRTVGWFTTITPVVLDLAGNSEIGDALRSVKDQLRAIPERGIGYGMLRYLSPEGEEELAELPPSEVSFNYLGQLDQAVQGPSPFVMAQESAGPSFSLEGRRSHLLGVNAFVMAGQLGVRWSYSTKVYRGSTIESLAEGYLDDLKELIRHCRDRDLSSDTKTDFSLSNISQKQLAGILGKLNKSRGSQP